MERSQAWSSPLAVTITGPNSPPAAPSVPSGTTSGSSGTSYSYSTKATDPDGDRVLYTFDWGDGATSVTSLVSSGASAGASHTWIVASGSTKTFSVSAKATDDNGAVSSGSSPLSVTITGPAAVNNPPATPSVPSGTTSGISGTSYSYSTKATDPDGDRVLYAFDWGDGTTSVTALVSSGASASASHTWTVASGSTKTFSVVAKATDDNGAVSSGSSPLAVTITGPAPVNNPPATPSVPSGTTSGISGTSYSYSTKATDPDGDRVLYAFDWGDGTTSVTALVSSGASASASHTWTVASGSTKTFSVVAKATDDNGAVSSGSSPLAVTITGPAPVNNPPATPSTPSGTTSGISGTSYSYSTKATDPDGDRVLYTFDWGDGTTSVTSLVSSGASASASHTWTVASGSTKTFSVRAKAADDSGMESGWSSPLSVTITGPNNPPATPSVPSGSTSGSSGIFYSYSTKATDPDGDKVKYTFDWGDGFSYTTYPVSSGASASASHTWTVASGSTKTFSVRAKAADDSGMESGWSSPLSVTITGPNNPPATPSVPSGSTSGSSGIFYSYSTKATDPDGDRVLYTFDWGDGTTSVTSLVSSGASASASHTWTVASGSTKTFSVSAKATDENGAVSSGSSTLSVTITGPIVIVTSVNDPPAAPSVPSGSTSGSSGISYSYSTKATDPDDDKVKYTFNWGDGTTSVTSLVSSGTSASASHIWTVASGSTKTFSVSAKATDDNGAVSSGSSPLSVTITGPNSPPAAPSVPSGSTSGSSGTSYSYSTKATDPDGDRVLYTFDWGDGTTSVTSLVNSGASASASHTWIVASGSTKTFSVRAKAADDSGMESSWSSTLAVTITDPVDGGDANSPPAKAYFPTGDSTSMSGETHSYSTEATDPDGDKVKYTFDWGDGTTSTTSLVSSGASASASHKWTIDPGTVKIFSVRAKATDEHGIDGLWSNSLLVYVLAERLQRPPTTPSKPVGPTSGKTGVSYSYSTSSTDPDGDKIKYTFDWGDGFTETAFFPSGQTVTASHIWTHVPAGQTWTYSVNVDSSDSRSMPGGISESLVVAITGSSPLTSVQKLSSLAEGDETINVQTEYAQTEENESVDAQTEEADSVDVQTEEADSVDAQTEEADSVDAQTNETDSVDTQTEEADSVDAQTNETDSVDAQTEEADSVDAQTNEADSVDAQTNEADSVDTQTNETNSVDTQTNETNSVDTQTRIANPTKLHSPSS